MEFVTSTTLLNVALGKVNVVLTSSQTSKESDKLFRFIELFFPRDEDGVDRLLRFVEQRQLSYKLRNKQKEKSQDESGDFLQVA